MKFLHATRRTQNIAIIIFVLLALGGFGFFFQDSYFAPYPYIDTVLAPGFSWEGYDLIEPGMTRAEVSELIGENPYVKSTRFPRRKGTKTGPYFPNAYCDVYSDDKHIWGAWIKVNVCYDNEAPGAVVVGTNELISYN